MDAVNARAAARDAANHAEALTEQLHEARLNANKFWFEAQDLQSQVRRIVNVNDNQLV